MTSKCDGYKENFTLSYVLSCIRAGLIIMPNTEIKDALGDLLSQALTPSALQDKPSIKPKPRVRKNEQKVKDNNTENVAEQKKRRGNLLFQGLSGKSKHFMIDVIIKDVTQPFCINKFPKKVLESVKKVKKQNT